MIKSHRFFAPGYQLLIQHVEHLQERAVGRDPFDLIGDEFPFVGGALLTPYLECEIHIPYLFGVTVLFATRGYL